MTAARRRTRFPWWRYLAGAGALVFGWLSYEYVTLPDVRAIRTTNPGPTAFMTLRANESHRAGKPFRPRQVWVPFERIAPDLRRAVLVAEDSAFWQHDGVDYRQLRESLEDGLERGELTRGASTITQQLAKNLYLSPSRNPVRKLRELVITRHLERVLSKRRILELYLNVAEWGDGIFGAEAAAETYFAKPAEDLDADEAALLAGCLINPRRYSPKNPPRRLLNRQRMILERLHTVSAG